MKSALPLSLWSALSLLAAAAVAQEPSPPTPPVAQPPALPAPQSPGAPPPAAAGSSEGSDGEATPPLDRRVEELDQKLRVIERRWEIEQEQAAERKAEEKKNPASVAVAYAKDGVTIKSADGAFSFRLRPIVQVDGRFFFSDPSTNTFLLRRVRPVIEGTVFNFFDWRMMPELAGTPNVQDAYVNIRLLKEVQLRAGKFKPPVGIERLASDPDLPLVERGLTTNLVPDRDVGVQLHGDILDGTITFAAGIFNGVGDGVNGDLDNNNKKDLVGRIFLHPFRVTPVEPLQKLGLGFAATRGTHVGALPAFRTMAQATLFQYATSAIASGTHRRIAPQAYFYLGPFGAFGEYVRSSQIVSNGAATQRVDHESWEVVASFFITGEDASYTTVTPKESLDLTKGTIGAVELAARYGVLTIDPETFRLRFADPNTQPAKAKEWAVGLNWHFARNFKLMVDYERTDFEGGARAGDRQKELVLLTRLQAAY